MSARADAWIARVAPSDLVALAKPRITLLVLCTVAAGFALAPDRPGAPLSSGAAALLLAHTLLGTALVAGGTNALNQVLEVDVDARMRRTARRPLPAGRLSARDASAFAWSAGTTGVAYLWLAVDATTALLAAITLTSYVLVYTPLKRRSALATLVGAVPGALPIVGGWTAADGPLDARVAVLFGLLFLWQLPHFLALSWIYRDDYARAGLRMLSVDDADGRRTFAQAALAAAALLFVGALPTVLGMAGAVYFFAALAVSGLYLAAALRAAARRTVGEARRLFLVSLVHLPAILLLLTLDRRP